MTRKEKMQEYLDKIKNDHEYSLKEKAALDDRLADVKRILLHFSGAIQVLEEVISEME